VVNEIRQSGNSDWKRESVSLWMIGYRPEGEFCSTGGVAIAEAARGLGLKIEGIRWVVRQDKRTGKSASSLVIYLNTDINYNQRLRIGRRVFRTTQYDWDR